MKKKKLIDKGIFHQSDLKHFMNHLVSTLKDVESHPQPSISGTLGWQLGPATNPKKEPTFPPEETKRAKLQGTNI